MKKKNVNEVQVSKKYRLSADEMNIIVQAKHHNQKKDTIEWKNVAYFSNPRNALNYIVEAEIREFWVEDLKEIVRKMDELKDMIRQIPDGILPAIGNQPQPADINILTEG